VWSRLRRSDQLSPEDDVLHHDWRGWERHDQLPNTLYLHLPRAEGDLTLQQLDLEGYCVSSGSACASGALEPSPTLLALGFAPEDAKRGVRVSLGPTTTHAEVMSFVEALLRALAPIRV
jgi:cysteine desulfurase